MPAFNPTLGNSAANSYVGTQTADDYFSNTLSDQYWSVMTTDEKQAALIAATRRLETLSYIGNRCSPSTNDPSLPQSLQWPRSGASCREVEATCDALPKPIVDAVCWLALQLHTSPPVPGAPATGSTGAIKSQKLGDLEQSFYDVKEGQSLKVDASAPLIMQQYPELVDIIGCWSTNSTGGSKLLLRVRS